jgi:hypothetical protein
VWEAQGSPLGPVESLHLLLFLDYPVICHRKLSNLATTFTGDLSWREGDSWMRQTRITHDDRRQGDTITNLRTSGHVINIGELSLNLFLESLDLHYYRPLECLQGHTSCQRHQHEGSSTDQ